MSLPRILVITGASGAGKTATFRALEDRAVPGVRCFYFDSIGVPTAEDMESDHGGSGVHDIDVAELPRILKEQGMTDVYDPATPPGVPRLS